MGEIMKKSINLKKGVSLIVLVITIVLILIISSVVIMSFNDSNTLENANISKFVSNREAYQESLRLYINDAQTKTFSNYSVVELLTGNNGNDTYKIISSNSTYQLNINGIIVNAYKIDEGLFKQKLNIEINTDLPNNNWYVSSEGNIYYGFSNQSNIPKWLYVDGTLISKVSNFLSESVK